MNLSKGNLQKESLPIGNIVQLTGNKIINKDDIKPNPISTSSDIIQNSFFTQNFLFKKYSPFSLELKKIIPSQVYDYGQNFSVEIPIFGNILYRCFFEIQLPILNFTDSIITDVNYTQYKQNNLFNITTEINYWTTQINNMTLYSNIQINGYVEAKSLLKLNNISLSLLQSRMLLIYNGYKDALYQYKLLLDSNIITSVDILGYILNLTTLNITATVAQLDSIYNNISNTLNYYQSNKQYSINQYNIVNRGKLLTSWIDHLGHFYFNFFEMNIDGFTLDNYSSDYLHIKQTHSVDINYIDNYNKLIGNTEDIYINKGSPNIIYTPLIFNFSNITESINALPLVGMINSSIKINSQINTLQNLVYLQDWEAMYNKLLLVVIKRKNHVIDSTTNTVTPADLPYISVNMLVPEYIYQYQCNTVDKRVLDTTYPGIDSDTILSKYGSFNDTYNEMVLTLANWILLMNCIVNKTDTYLQEGTKITLAGYHYFIDYNYLLNLIPKPNINLLVEYGYLDNYENKIMSKSSLEYIVQTRNEVSLTINDNSIYDSLNGINGLVKEIYLFTRQKLYNTGVSQYGKHDPANYIGIPNTIDTITLNVANEYNLFDFYNTSVDTYNNVIAYNNLTAPVPSGVFYKTFSLNPNIIQPSGSINMNVLTGQNIAIVVNDNNDIYYNMNINPYKLGTEFKLIYTKYNILKVQNGSADLVFYS
jgi:hypothetical protein